MNFETRLQFIFFIGRTLIAQVEGVLNIELQYTIIFEEISIE